MPIPSVVSNIFSHFPLVTYPAPPTTSSAPTSPTLWLLGPPPASTTESLDPLCRQAQALARFTSTTVIPRYLSSSSGAPGSVLPALHLPNGALLSATEVTDHLLPPPAIPKTADPKQQAFFSLVNTTLLPAVLAIVYLAPPTPVMAVIPPKQLPLLSAWAASWASGEERKERINEILRLRGKKVGIKAVLDLEQLERDGLDTITALEAVVKAQGDAKWFEGASAPTILDALLYALLSIILLQPSSTSVPLKDKLERCPSLLAWITNKKA
ncbi:hypothetical protein P7C70_g6146, partial [Phenoliferia sp. Uapishka_3]